MATRPTHCVDCGAPIVQAKRGGCRLRCSECQRKRLRAYQREWERRQKRLPSQKRPHYFKAYRIDRRAEMLALYGNACQRCGCVDLSILEQHHTKGGCAADYPCYPPRVAYHGHNLVHATLQWVAQNGSLPPDIELRCPPCHQKADKTLKARLEAA
jgi:hypothetical protein